jgi:hypothetical protein
MRQNVFGEEIACAGQAVSSIATDLDRTVDQGAQMNRGGFAEAKNNLVK